MEGCQDEVDIEGVIYTGDIESILLVMDSQLRACRESTLTSLTNLKLSLYLPCRRICQIYVFMNSRTAAR
jgi:hypothetical protein